LCHGRSLSAAAVDAPRLRHFATRRPPVHHARGHFRHSRRRVLLADHPVHDLRRVFYYSVLSEVSPPTALSPFAAAAITGGDPYKTTLQAWKYTLPAFLVPFVFVLDPQGIGLLLKLPKDGSWIDIVLITAKSALGLAALAAAAQGWALRKTTLVERLLLALAGL